MSKILIVEDERMLIEMYQEKFTQEGFEVDLARSAEQGLELVKKNPDLVLLDILLPKGNGIYFLKQMKKTDFASIPVVAFSNYNDPGTKHRAKELGVKDYLIKTNYTPDQVVEKVKDTLSNL